MIDSDEIQKITNNKLTINDFSIIILTISHYLLINKAANIQHFFHPTTHFAFFNPIYISFIDSVVGLAMDTSLQVYLSAPKCGQETNGRHRSLD